MEKRPNNNRKDKTIEKLKAISHPFGEATTPYEEIYERDIRFLMESPYIFNAYHWTTAIRTQTIHHVKGVNELLGYRDEAFNLQKSIEIIHPNYRAFVTEYGLMAYQMLTERRYLPLSMKAHYCIQYPVQRLDGQFVLVQMNASVIQVDSNLYPLANYNRFDVLGNYHDEPLIVRPYVYFRSTNNLKYLANEAEQELTARVRDNLLRKLRITGRELLILKDFGSGLKGTEV
jgi:hypothetical protein